MDRNITRLETTLPGLYDLAIGGTAVGTGLNSHPEFAERASSHRRINRASVLPVIPTSLRRSVRTTSSSSPQAPSRRSRNAHEDRERHSLAGLGPPLRACRTSASENEPRSSIMPGKVNPPRARP